MLALPVVTGTPSAPDPCSTRWYPLLYSLYVGLPTLGPAARLWVPQEDRPAPGRARGPDCSRPGGTPSSSRGRGARAGAQDLPLSVKAMILAALCAALLAGTGLDAWGYPGLARLPRWFYAWLAPRRPGGRCLWIADARAAGGPLFLSRHAAGLVGEVGPTPTPSVAPPRRPGPARARALRDRGARAASPAVAASVGELLAAHRGLAGRTWSCSCTGRPPSTRPAARRRAFTPRAPHAAGEGADPAEGLRRPCGPARRSRSR
jgi:hypothetical protein